MWKDRTQLFGKFTTQEKRYRSKCLKQADVVALMAVFTESFTLEQKKASYEYYKPITIHDSSNSMCHHQILAANIGDAEEAYANWLQSIGIDFGKRPRASDGVHFANVGGMWQEIVFGFAGVISLLNTDTLTLNPCMPKQIKSISFRLSWKGDWVRITVRHGEVMVENLSGRNVEFVVKGKRNTVAAGGTARVAY